MQNPPVASGSSAPRMCAKTTAAWPSTAPTANPEPPCLSSFQKKDLRFPVFSTPPTKPASALLSPESKRETPFSPSFQQKDVLLFEWWLMKTEKGYNGKRLAVGGFTKRSEAVGIFNSAPIIKRHDDYTLETADGITVRIQGPINEIRTFDDGFPFEVSAAFLFGFPTTWDTFMKESSGDRPTHQPEITFDPSSQKRTVLLRNWWLRRTEKGSDGNTLAVGGFSERGKAMRIFNSSPITKRHDVCTIETADGITIRIQGFINKTRTLDNGFPVEACKIFFSGFPTTWTKFAILSSGDKPSNTETPVNTSISADWYKDFLENLPFGFPVPSESTNLENVPLTSKTSICDFTAILLVSFHKSIARGSIPSSVHSPLVDISSHHLPAKKLCDNNCVQTDKICETNVTYAQTVRKDREYHVLERTPTNRCCKKASHSEADGCQISILHVDGLPQEISVDHGKLDFIQEETLQNGKKSTGHALTTGHHDDLVKIYSTGVSSDFVIGKDLDKQERTVQKKDEIFYECSTRRIEKVRSGLTKPDNLHSEDQNFAKFSAKPVRRSKRLRLQKVGNVQGDFQDYSQFLNETNEMDGAKSALDGSKTSAASQPNEILVEGSPSSSIFYQEVQIFGESPAEPAVRKGERFELLTVGNAHGESQVYSQLLNETSNVNSATLAPALDGSKTYVTSPPIDTVLTESILSPTESIRCPSAGVLSEENQVGIAENPPPNSEVFASPTLGKNIIRHCKKIKDNQPVRNRMTVEQNDSRNRQDFSNSEENMFISSASNSRSKSLRIRTNYKTKNVGVSRDMGKPKCKGPHTTGCKTVWVSSYTDVHRAPSAQCKGIDLSFLTPEPLSLKRSRSGRLLLPALDCSTRIIYDADGSIAGTASVDGSIARTSIRVMTSSQCNDKKSTTPLGRKRKKQQ
ncbi:hypothetical protein KSP39_PZI021543 [Platanthera zijinensis]|uniref:SANTA domain-containing protein n=1 Tax=Platanthera zijinensis TaxID=2320716 RepID=A0AAP0AYU2_9ASPA